MFQLALKNNGKNDKVNKSTFKKTSNQIKLINHVKSGEDE